MIKELKRKIVLSVLFAPLFVSKAFGDGWSGGMSSMKNDFSQVGGVGVTIFDIIALALHGFVLIVLPIATILGVRKRKQQQGQEGSLEPILWGIAAFIAAVFLEYLATPKLQPLGWDLISVINEFRGK